MEQVPTWVEAFEMRTLPDRCIMDTRESGRKPIDIETIDFASVFDAALTYRSALLLPAAYWRFMKRREYPTVLRENTVISAMDACFAMLYRMAESFGHDNPFDVCVIGPTRKVDGIMRLGQSADPVYLPIMNFVNRKEGGNLNSIDPREFMEIDPQVSIDLIDIALFQLGYVSSNHQINDPYTSSILVWPDRGVLIFRGKKYTGLSEQCCRWVEVLKRARGRIVSRREAAQTDGNLLEFRPKRLIAQLPSALANRIVTDYRGSRLDL